MVSVSPDAPSLECLQQRDSNLAHSSSELTGKQWNSVLLGFFLLFLSEREKEKREKLASAENSENGPDRSYCYEISLFHGQDHYISLAGQTKHHVSSAEAPLLPRELDRGKQNFRKEPAWKGIRVQLSLKQIVHLREWYRTPRLGTGAPCLLYRVGLKNRKWPKQEENTPEQDL